MAEMLMNKNLPTVEGIKQLHKTYSEQLPSVESLKKREAELRQRLNNMLNSGEIDLYPRFKEKDELIQILADSNNIREFKYE